MFEEVELGNAVSKGEYREQTGPLRLALLRHQFELKEAGFPVIVLLAGDDRIGRDSLLHLMTEWLDPRFVEVQALGPPSEEERERPAFWRFWRRLPARGRIGVFVGGWVTQGLLSRIRGDFDDEKLGTWLGRIRELEEALVSDGAVLVKIWTHIPKAELKARLAKAERKPDQFWQVGEVDREIFENYDEGALYAERMLRETSTGAAPWHILESTDVRAANLGAGRILLKAMSKGMQREPRPAETPTMELAIAGVESEKTVLDRVDTSQRLTKEEYEKRLVKEQGKIRRLVEEAARREIGSVLVFEGWDAAGKGGAVRRLSRAIPPTLVRIVPIAAPTEEERAHHYLWRFWRQLPADGTVRIFDRSWYGRVLVERIEGFATREEWGRAYKEIADFERQLWQHGYLVHKFWIHIDKDEQLRRFKAREEDPAKRWKITEEDWRNRERWELYEGAVNEMVQRCSVRWAPWTIVAGNDKRSARIQVLGTYRKRLEERLES